MGRNEGERDVPDTGDTDHGLLEISVGGDAICRIEHSLGGVGE